MHSHTSLGQEQVIISLKDQDFPEFAWFFILRVLESNPISRVRDHRRRCWVTWATEYTHGLCHPSIGELVDLTVGLLVNSPEKGASFLSQSRIILSGSLEVEQSRA